MHPIHGLANTNSEAVGPVWARDGQRENSLAADRQSGTEQGLRDTRQSHQVTKVHLRR